MIHTNVQAVLWVTLNKEMDYAIVQQETTTLPIPVLNHAIILVLNVTLAIALYVLLVQLISCLWVERVFVLMEQLWLLKENVLHVISHAPLV
jgi:hypothetical protein